MKKQFLQLLALLCCGLIASSVSAGVAYPNPPGGWTYIYNGDKDTAGEPDSGFTSLDGTWSHDNGSDQFDGSKIGGKLLAGDFGVGNAPGGVMTITEGGVTFLRMQDPGDPRNYGYPDPPSNRKLYFGHDITADGAADTILDDGVTLTFRARIPTPKKTTAPLDPLHLTGQADAGPKPYYDGGDGYLISDGGKGNVGIKQLAGGIISFALTVPNDNFDDGVAGAPKANFAGLTMNQLNGTSPSASVNFDSSGDFRGIAFDPTEWHEFWITIKADVSGLGTHEVTVYMDGSSQAATNVVVSAGNGNDFNGVGYLAIGGSRTVESWALDLDFVAFKAGVEAPPKSAAEAPKFSPVVRQGNNLILSWTGSGTLQAADSVGGPYTDVAGVKSPQTVALSGNQKFYRLKQ
jgi:hypothetical protein